MTAIDGEKLYRIRVDSKDLQGNPRPLWIRLHSFSPIFGLMWVDSPEQATLFDFTDAVPLRFQYAAVIEMVGPSVPTLSVGGV